MISPRVAARLRRIRSGSICSPSSTSAMFAAAPPAAASTPVMPSHSACQAPAARSCSCARLPIRRPAAACARRAQASVSVDPTGLRLWARVEDPPRPAAGRLAHLADLGLGQQHDVEGDLAERPRQRGAAPIPAPRRARARCARAAIGSASSRSLAKRVDDLRPGDPERRERAGGAAQLHCQRSSRASNTQRPGLEHADQPRRCLEAERRRQRLLQQRARDHRRRALCLGELGAGGRHGGHVGQHEIEGAPADEHGGRVDDVLAGRSVVHVACGVFPDGRTQGAHQRLGRVAHSAALGGDAIGVEELGAAGGGDRLRGRGRDDARGRLGLRQGPLGVEHRLQPGAVAELFEQSLRDEDRVEHCSDPLADRRSSRPATVAAACELTTLRSCESCSFCSNGSPSGERCSMEVIHQEKCSARQTRRRHVSE